jgi:hypothetical protein
VYQNYRVAEVYSHLYDLMQRESELESELAATRSHNEAIQKGAGQPQFEQSLSHPSPPSPGLHNRTVTNLMNFMRELATHWPTQKTKAPTFVTTPRQQGQGIRYWNSEALKPAVLNKKPQISAKLPNSNICRALLTHWIEAVQPEFPLLTTEQLEAMRTYYELDIEARPMPEPSVSVLLNGVLAVSAALISRDFSKMYGDIAEQFFKILQDDNRTAGHEFPHDTDGAERELLTLLFQALYLLIRFDESPCDIFTFITLVGRRYVEMLGRRGAHLWSAPIHPIGICIGIIEKCVMNPYTSKQTNKHSTITLKFGLPSLLMSSLEDALSLPTPLQIQLEIRQLSLTTIDNFDHTKILSPNFSVIIAHSGGINFYQTLKFIAMYQISLSEASKVISSLPLDHFGVKAAAQIASVSMLYVQDTFNKDKGGLNCSLSVTAERLLQAGAALAAQLIVIRLQPESLSWHGTSLTRSETLHGLVQVSQLLSSFEYRCPACTEVSSLWNAFHELVLGIAG